MPVPLTREDIVGHRIVSVHIVWSSQQGVDFASSYLTLDSGLILMMPIPGSLPESVDAIPEEAVLATGHFAQRVTAHPIAALYGTQDEDGFIDPQSLIVTFTSGEWLVDRFAEPTGIGAGPFIYPKNPEDADPSFTPVGREGWSPSYRDFWSLDLEADQRWNS